MAKGRKRWLALVGLAALAAGALALERWPGTAQIRAALRDPSVPAKVVDDGTMGRVLRTLGVVRAAPGDREATIYVVTPRGERGSHLVISEIMASASDRPDWIEIHNSGRAPVDLEGWLLSDDPDRREHWPFPAASVPPGGYLVVLASGRGRPGDDGTLHASFRLSRGGEYLALIRPDGTVAHEYAPAFPAQVTDLSYGLAPDRTGWLARPTPGGPNADPLAGVVEPVRFSRPHGLCDDPFTLELATDTPRAEIRYTLDGSRPDETGGQVYRGPMPIEGTTVVRAGAFRPGFAPSPLVTCSYLFVDQVLRQPARPAGFPASWITAEADYEMDARVVNDPAYRNDMSGSLRALPSVSLVMDLEDLFGPAGVYSNPEARGPRWERPASLELIYSDGRPGLQVGCGVRLQGNESRLPDQKKHSFRLVFRSRYGPGRLEHRLFPETSRTRFDTLVLRSADDSWLYYEPPVCANAMYVRDQWARDTDREMGRLAAAGTWVHLYLNGLYWGVYNLIERPDASLMAEQLGGDPDDYDALRIRVGEVDLVDGNLDAWSAMMALAEAGLDDRERYETICREYLDPVAFIDYLLVHLYNGAEDWSLTNGNNIRVARRRAPGAKFHFFTWDADSTFGSGWVTDSVEFTIFPMEINEPMTPSRLLFRLAQNPDFRTLFADRVHRHFFGEGALTPARARARYLAIADRVEPALLAESARWGDTRRPERPYTLDNQWRPKQRWLLEEWFPRRTAIVVEQLRQVGLYPGLDPPAVERRGDTVTLTIPGASADERVGVYYTIDGTDPRRCGGSVAETARRYERPVTLRGPLTLKARARGEDVWSALTEVPAE